MFQAVDLFRLSVAVIAAMSLLPLSAASQSKTTAAVQQSEDEPEIAKGWSLEAGATSLIAPNRSGGRQYLFHPVPLAELSYGDVFEISTREGASYAIFADPSVKAGLLFDLDRKERAARSAVGRPVLGAFGTGGLGGFAEWVLPQDAKARLALTEGVLERRGLKSEMTFEKSYQLAPQLTIDLGAKVKGGDRLYVDSIYSPPASTRGRRLTTEAVSKRKLTVGSGGVTTIGPTTEARYALGKNDTISATIEADRLVGAAARSPGTRGSIGRHTAGTFELGWQRRLFSSE